MSKLLKAAVGIFVITLLSKFLGMAREMVLAYKYGASYISDAYVISTTLPTVVFAILLSGIARTYIPVYSRLESDEERKRLDGNVMTITFLLSCILTLLFLMLRKYIVLLLAPGFEATTYSLVVKMTSVMILLLPIMAGLNVLAGYLNYREHFLILSFCNYIVINIFIIIAIVVSSEEHIMLLPIIYVVGEVITLGILWIYSSKVGFVYRPRIDIRDKGLKELFILAVPMGLSLMLNQFNSVIDRVLASMLPEGTITALNYANKVQILILGLTITIIATVSYPKLNRLFAEKKTMDALIYVNKGMMLTAFICIPATFALVILAEPIVKLLFERGSFDSTNTVVTAQCLAAYGLGLLFYGYREILTQALGANKLQKGILTNTVIAIGCNVGLNLILIRFLGHIGLALATSIAGLISYLSLYHTLKKECGNVVDRESFKELVKMLIAAIIMATIVYLVFQMLLSVMGSNIALIWTSFLGVLIYFALTYFLQVKECIWVIQKGIDFLKLKGLR